MAKPITHLAHVIDVYRYAHPSCMLQPDRPTDPADMPATPPDFIIEKSRACW
ncbi:hypothetical protein [Bradyrhizobium sp. CCBAU 051011]|uniref:hypothetical protein n=1 Tax=Bradyrhizobium sp. CCBAU 051011 TaxID=858422 RepID=UPI00137AB6AE|nr:hypothetical protein [Bradyrhizobium sp. CCBAU 051011]